MATSDSTNEMGVIGFCPIHPLGRFLLGLRPLAKSSKSNSPTFPFAPSPHSERSTARFYAAQGAEIGEHKPYTEFSRPEEVPDPVEFAYPNSTDPPIAGTDPSHPSPEE